MDAQIYSKNLDLVLQVYKWKIADDEDSKLRNYDIEGNSKLIAPKDYGAEHKMITDDIFIRLMEKKGNTLKTI